MGGSPKPGTWTVDANSGIITNPKNDEAWIWKSFQKTLEQRKHKKHKTDEIYVHFNTKIWYKKFCNRNFEIDPPAQKGRVMYFLAQIRDICKAKKDKGSKKENAGYQKAFKNIEDFIKEFINKNHPMKKRRRMAQRTFSNRRDSPVMLRLLSEICRANGFEQ